MEINLQPLVDLALPRSEGLELDAVADALGWGRRVAFGGLRMLTPARPSCPRNGCLATVPPHR